MTKARDLANIISGGFDATDIPNLDTAKITSGTFVDARLPATALNSNVDLTTLSASNLTSGTLADARFPATLPAISGANLTSLPSSNPYTAQSNTEAGYIKLVGGVIIQWGLFGTFGIASSGTVNFATTFPSNLWSLTVGLWNNNTNNLYSLVVARTPSTSQFTWYQGDTGNTGRVGSYIAVGK